MHAFGAPQQLAPVAATRGDWRDRLRTRRGRRRALWTITVVLVLVVSAFVLLGRVGQLEDIAYRLQHASPRLLILAVVLEILSFAGYVVLTRVVFRPAAARITWIKSIEITLAGVVATRLVTAGGAGGIALTDWALRAAGLEASAAAVRQAAFLVVLYAVFFAALLVGGTALAIAGLHGAARSLGLAGGALGGLVIAVALGTLLIPPHVDHRVPAVARAGVALAGRIVRGRPSAVLAALAWWGFDVGVLWTTFDMFGAPPAAGVLVLCYFLGHVAQVIPLPGGIGPVEGGMVAAFAACGVPVGLAVLAVLSYQAISAWLPALPGAWGYLRLRRSVADWRAER